MITYLKELYISLYKILRSPYKWLAIFFILWLYRVDFIPADGGGLAKGLQVITILGLLYCVYKRKRNIINLSYTHTNFPIKSIMWLYTFAILSTMWAYLPSFAFFLSLQNLVLLFTLIWLFSLMKSFKTIEKTFLYFSIIITIFEVVTERIINHPNIFIHFLSGGSASAICISYCFGELMAKKKMDLERENTLRNTLILSIIILITSTSSGANIAAILGCCIALLFSGNIIWTCLILIIGVILYLNQDLIMHLMLLVMPGKTEAIIESGNGRETIWNGILAVAAQRPLIGWGYACGERVASNYLNWTLSDSHNNYLGVYGGLGWIGLFFLIIHQIVTLWTAFTKRMKIGYTGLLCGLCCATINGYSYGYLSGKACSITVIYFSMVILTFIYSKIRNYD
ncbi:O-antigen ligase family protein [Phocaeicola coprophilus]